MIWLYIKVLMGLGKYMGEHTSAYFLALIAKESRGTDNLQAGLLSVHKWLPSEELSMGTQNTFAMKKPTSVKALAQTSDQSYQ